MTHHPQLALLEGYAKDLAEKTPCWVCRSTEWTLSKSDESFGVHLQGNSATDLNSSTNDHMSAIVLVCTKCANMWFLNVPIASYILQDRDES